MNEFNKHFLSSCVPSTVLGIGDSVLWWKGHSYHFLRYIFWCLISFLYSKKKCGVTSLENLFGIV